MITEFEKKCNESKRVRDKFPDRIPVIVGKAKGCNLNDIDKKIENLQFQKQFIHWNSRSNCRFINELGNSKWQLVRKV